MKASDTVIELRPCVKTKTQYPANQVAEAQVIIDQKQMERQAEISFKAGIREVVYFIGEDAFEHNYSMYGHQINDCFACEYEAKLKEWRVKG